ncbi:hypothetical protein V8G54_014560 [Vigna mungo]|uniref:Uncharacterized protein n=1 Tax=Vigna mungo TaxID=3915 RepID=A0AAQ3NJE9_VIGMU
MNSNCQGFREKHKVMCFKLNLMGMKGLVCLMWLSMWVSQSQGRLLSIPSKPDPNDAAATARWLVSLNFWGVLKYFSFSLHLFHSNSELACSNYSIFLPLRFHLFICL